LHRRFLVTRNAEISGLPINQAIAFSNKKGEFKEGIKTKQLSMLKDYEALLKQFLEPGEEILLALRGCSPMTALEQLTMGWSVAYLKRCTFVITDRRILHFPSKSDYKPRHSISQIRFGDVEEIKPSTFLGRFKVIYKDGKKEIFNYVKGVAKLKAMLQGLQLQRQPATRVRTRHHLCPRCTTPLPAGVYTCAACALEFKNEKKARTLSLLIPGGGYFYTNHPLLGLQDFLVEAFLIAMVITSAFNVLSSTDAAENAGVFVLFSLVLALEKAYTVYHAKHYVREYIPLDVKFEPRRQ
jgi:hypothetical protein